MSVCVVTGYVPLPCEHRSRDRYNDLGGRLLDACPRSILFRSRLEDCWLTKRLGGVEPGGKDTPAYHCVQHEKFGWLNAACSATDATTLIWMDYGILHMEGMYPELVAEFIQRVEDNEPDVIVSPSGSDRDPYGPLPDWRFLGAALIVPRTLVPWLFEKCRVHSDPISWEVNTLSRVAINEDGGRFRFYEADHTSTIFTNYA